MGQSRNARIRRDGWTAERQLRFLDALAETRSVTESARAAGMSRESAYRFRNRAAGALFRGLWNLTLQPSSAREAEVHIDALSTGSIMRLLGRRYRRERGDSLNVGAANAGGRHT